MAEVFESGISNEQTEKLEKLFQAARNARAASDDETAMKHYQEISAINPDSWEAMFYLVILKTNKITNGEIGSSAVSVQNCLPKVFELIKNTIADADMQKKAVKEVANQCWETASWLTSASENFYKSITAGNGTMAMTGIFGAATSLDATQKARAESQKRYANIGNIMCLCGNLIETLFDFNDEFYRNTAAWAWEKMLDMHFNHIRLHKTAVFSEESISKFATKVKNINTSYVLPDIKATGNRNYKILAVALGVAVFAIGIIYALWINNLF